jgi:DNA-directed RNA polymerase subunit RPC12/RpoP
MLYHPWGWGAGWGGCPPITSFGRDCPSQSPNPSAVFWYSGERGVSHGPSFCPRFALRFTMCAVILCQGCGRYFDQIGATGPARCQNCQDRAAELERIPPRIVGRQPVVCLACGEPFQASRFGQRYHNAACRARAWHARQRETPTVA